MAGARYCLFSLVVFLFPLGIFAQGVPKAFEAVTYRASLNGHAVTFILANGYIAGSMIKLHVPGDKKPVVFRPEGGEADEGNRLKFVNDSKEYVILYNMQAAYDEIPGSINGKFYTNHKVKPLKFWLIK